MKFRIPIEPVGQMRARHGRVKLKSGKTFSKTYKHETQTEREAELSAILMRYKPATPLLVPVAFGLIATITIPESWTRKKKALAASGEIRPASKPDLDNIIKHVKDCLTKTGFWKDDAQVVEYLPGTRKVYGFVPSLEIEIVPIQEGKAWRNRGGNLQWKESTAKS